ncbi:hypothetical protein H2248_001762 [Termitomyces sp. 'cryptogamus']|nr:hypothetical protein H2248_001762 [Termitomyces sp. 'cryptogamus']
MSKRNNEVNEWNRKESILRLAQSSCRTCCVFVLVIQKESITRRRSQHITNLLEYFDQMLSSRMTRPYSLGSTYKSFAERYSISHLSQAFGESRSSMTRPACDTGLTFQYAFFAIWIFERAIFDSVSINMMSAHSNDGYFIVKNLKCGSKSGLG